MKKIKRIPYGASDFESIKLNNDYYVDKTNYIPLLELTRFQFLIRPRRFGKSLFLSMLHSYYDILNIDRFDELFRETYILDNPTEEKTSYMVLTFNFSAVNPDIDKVEDSFHEYCGLRIDDFVKKYKNYIDKDLISIIKEKKEAGSKLKVLASGLRNNPTKIYMMIDEYDNFANTIISRHGQHSYEKLTHSEGFFRYFFNVLKDMTSDSGSILARLFITGVSPITLDDVTSGFNIASNITIERKFNEILGFTTEDVKKIIDYYSEVGVFHQNKDKAFHIMKEWYDNYKFSKRATKKVFNTDMVLYYMMKSYDEEYPLEYLIDENVKIDYKKLEHFLTINRKLNGNFDVLEQLLTEEKISGSLVRSFPLKEITKRDNFISLLFYFGLITINREHRGKIEFTIPNNTIKELLYAFIRDGYKSVYDFNIDVFKLSDLVTNMAYDGDYEPAFRFIANEISRIIVLRDFIDGERVVGAYFLSLFSITNDFIIEHEKEQSLGFSDIVFKPFYDIYEEIEYGYLVEFKYISKKEWLASPNTSASLSDRPLAKIEGNSLVEEASPNPLLKEGANIKEYIAKATTQLKKYETDDKFKKELQLAPYGNKKLIKLILLFVGGEMKVLKRVE